MGVTELREPAAARCLVRVGEEQRLILAFAQHLTLRLELVGIVNADAQAGGVKQALKHLE